MSLRRLTRRTDQKLFIVKNAIRGKLIRATKYENYTNIRNWTTKYENYTNIRKRISDTFVYSYVFVFHSQIMKIIKNVLLKHHTSFKIGGPAKHFVEIKNREDLISAIKWARKNSLLFFVLGGGSNVLVSDNGFNGLVIKVKSQKLKVKSSIQKSKVLEAEAGVKLKDLVNLSAKEGLTGLEWAAGIPGTIGGAIYGNAAAFGKSMADVVESVEILEVRASREVEPPKIKILNNKQCQFSEKNSVFKQNKNLIILSAVLKLKKKGQRKNKK